MTTRLLYFTLACIVIGSSFADDRTRSKAVKSSKSTRKVIPANVDNLSFVNRRSEKKRPDVDQIGVNSAGISEVNFDEDEDRIPVKLTIGERAKVLPVNTKKFFMNNLKTKKSKDVEQMAVNSDFDADEDADSRPYSITVTDKASLRDADLDNAEFAGLQPRRGGGHGGGMRGGGRRFGHGRGRRFRRPFPVDEIEEPIDEEEDF